MHAYILANHFLIFHLAIGQAYYAQMFTDYSYPNYSFVNDIDDHNAFSSYHM